MRVTSPWKKPSGSNPSRCFLVPPTSQRPHHLRYIYILQREILKCTVRQPADNSLGFVAVTEIKPETLAINFSELWRPCKKNCFLVNNKTDWTTAAIYHVKVEHRTSYPRFLVGKSTFWFVTEGCRGKVASTPTKISARIPSALGFVRAPRISQAKARKRGLRFLRL